MPWDSEELPPIYDEEKVGTREGDIVEWAESRLKRGIKFVESSIGYEKINVAIQELWSYEQSTSASYVPGISSKLSQTRANLIAKIAEDLTAMLTDTRMFWNYSTQNPKFEVQARLSNKLAEKWYSSRLIDLRIGDVIRYYTFAGTGFAHLYYSRRINDMMLEAEDPRNVFPIDPVSYHTVQDALGIITRRPRTPDWIKDEYDKVVRPDMGGTAGFFGWLQQVVQGPGERGGPLTKRSDADKQIPGTPTTFVNTLYLNDQRVNKSGKIQRVGKWEDGKPMNTWSYEVRPGQPLFPFKRLIVWGGGALLDDGPSPHWHGKFPLIKFTLNPWPNSWFGKAPLWDCIPLQNSMTANLRVIDDHNSQVAQPAVIGDRNVSRAEMTKFDSRAPGAKIRTNMASGKGIQVVNPPPLDQMIMNIITWCEEKMMKIAGTADPSAMASLAQIPSDDTIDTIMKAMTPGIRLRSRILEGCYKELAEMYLWSIFQWDSLKKRLEILGPQAATNEDFDFNPGTMIPDNIPDGTPGDPASREDALGTDNPPQLYERAGWVVKAMECKFDPSSLLNSAAQQELLQYFMLAKMGYVSVFTIWDKMGKLAEFAGGVPVPTSEIQRLALQQQLGIGMIANAQGRKSTDAAPPAMGQTGNGPTITTS